MIRPPLAFIQMALSASPSAAAAAAQRIHHHASNLRTASLPSSALRQQAEEAMKATTPPKRHASIISENTTVENDTNKPMPEPLLPPKRVLIVRHGQAQHNPRAEAAREAGCAFDEFLRLMELDDAHDAELTDLGENQAQTARERYALSDVELVVSSPLSRALRTADLVHPPSESSESAKRRRIAIEHFREINGKLLNAQRRPRSDLVQKFPHWCFQAIPELDESWTEELESREDCSERGYRGLLWVLQQPEQNVLLVCHGGILNYTLNGHANVVLLDGRRQSNTDSESEEVRCVTKRFGNCELREFVITGWDSAGYNNGLSNGANQLEPVITLEEVTLSQDLSL
mmetsp:Transcript_32660/g.55688  ORF Transcript_32660/g.55688 Transcript_32660/m.55688 type:complete len:345 (-) Transcript_32660:831-1865(-)